MSDFTIKPIDFLTMEMLESLIIESKNEGFHFLERLKQDYIRGKNTFSLNGEILLGVFNNGDKLIAIGGLNQDPFNKEKNLGRFRRFYVSPSYRRKGIGRLLAEELLNHGSKFFDKIVLRTNTSEGSKFYKAIGFIETNGDYLDSTHVVSFII